MSTLKVEVVNIDNILPHSNAERLDIACIKGWRCIIGKGSLKVGDKAIYIPIDSMLPQDIEDLIFPPDSKIKLENHRIRTLKLRSEISQGLIVNFNTLKLDSNKYKVGDDLTDLLKITKYEPPAPSFQMFKGNIASKKQVNPNFMKYTDIENYKNYNSLFDPEDEVIISCKVHGSNARFMNAPFCASTWYQKLLKLFRLQPSHQFVYGSHNCQLQNKLTYKGFYDTNIYAEMVVKYNIKDRLPKGYAIYGEVYGSGVQVNFSYGCNKDEHKLVLFDVMKDGKYLSFNEYEEFCNKYLPDIPRVPVLFKGKFKDADLNKLCSGPSVLCPAQPIREGCVVKSAAEENSRIGRKILKVINPEYLLLKNNSEFH